MTTCRPAKQFDATDYAKGASRDIFFNVGAFAVRSLANGTRSCVVTYDEPTRMTLASTSITVGEFDFAVYGVPRFVSVYAHFGSVSAFLDGSRKQGMKPTCLER